MTANGTHEHYTCDGCAKKVTVRMKWPAGPGNPLITTVTINSGGSRLDKIEHLCESCRNKLDTHFFGATGCDGPKVRHLEGLLERAIPALQEDVPHSAVEHLIGDIQRYFDPPIQIEAP